MKHPKMPKKQSKKNKKKQKKPKKNKNKQTTTTTKKRNEKRVKGEKKMLKNNFEFFYEYKLLKIARAAQKPCFQGGMPWADHWTGADHLSEGP